MDQTLLSHMAIWVQVLTPIVTLIVAFIAFKASDAGNKTATKNLTSQVIDQGLRIRSKGGDSTEQDETIKLIAESILSKKQSKIVLDFFLITD